MSQPTNGDSTLISGIYQIKNTINGKIYVGSSINLKQRFNDHKKLLRYNKHANKHLQFSWIKYGESAFVFNILEFVNVEFLITREQHYINLFSSFNKTFGYNIAKIAGNTLGTKRSEKQKINMSLSKLSNNEERISNIINLTSKIKNDSLYFKNGKETKIVDTTNPFYNKKHNTQSKEKMRLAKLGKPSNSINRPPYTLTEEHKKNIAIGNSGKNNKKSKPVLQYDTKNNLIKEWDSAGMAAKALSLSVGNIWMCCNNKARTSYGFIWKYKK